MVILEYSILAVISLIFWKKDVSCSCYVLPIVNIPAREGLLVFSGLIEDYISLLYVIPIAQAFISSFLWLAQLLCSESQLNLFLFEFLQFFCSGLSHCSSGSLSNKWSILSLFLTLMFWLYMFKSSWHTYIPFHFLNFILYITHDLLIYLNVFWLCFFIFWWLLLVFLFDSDAVHLWCPCFKSALGYLK